MKKINWGIMGCAGIAKKEVIPAILKAENGQLYAVASRNETKAKDFAENFKAEKYYLDYKELLNDDKVEAVYIPLPNSLHKEWAIEAINAGKPVLCEKPLGLDLAEVEEIIEKARENDVLLMEAFMYRFHPLTRKIKETVDRGVIGELKHIEANFAYYNTHSDQDIRFNKELGGGALYDVGCYTVNMARYLAGELPEKVYNTFVERPGSGVDDQGTAILKFSNGLLASLYYGFVSNNKDLVITGTEGRIKASGFFQWAGEEDRSFCLETEDGVEKVVVPGKEQYQIQVEEFARAIIDGKEAPLAPGEDTVNNFKVLDALFKSAATGKEVEV